MCERVVEKWQQEGPKPLNTVQRKVDGTLISEKEHNEDEEKKQDDVSESTSSREYQSGIWLFTDRNNPTHFFKPNFLPPYDTPEKKKIIYEFLKEEWDEPNKQWRKAGGDDGAPYDDDDDENTLENLFERMGLSN